MKVFDGDPSQWVKDGTRAAVAIGVFDGVHLGHAAVLDGLRGRAGDVPVIALTFATHPIEVVTGESAPLGLLTLSRRIEMLGDAGVDGVALIEFDEYVSELSPEAFMDIYLVGGLNALHVSVGEDFRFGHCASGSVETLTEWGRGNDFDVLSVPIVELESREVRSSAIRGAVASGDVELASRMLGRPFGIEGCVVRGDGRGREMGFPTANIKMGDRLVRPAQGVYAVRCEIDGEICNGVSNVGTRPTFVESGEVDKGGEVIEVHLLDHDGDLYGENVRVQFIKRLRDEEHFESENELINQIRSDIEDAVVILE